MQPKQQERVGNRLFLFASLKKSSNLIFLKLLKGSLVEIWKNSDGLCFYIQGTYPGNYHNKIIYCGVISVQFINRGRR